MTTTPSLHAQIMALHVTHHAFGDRVSRHAAAELALAADAETERLTVELAREKRGHEHYTNEWSDACNENQVLLNELAALKATQELTDEQIIKIAETMGRDISGKSNYESWGQGYRKDESGAYRIPNAPKLCVPFARAILAAAKETK